MFSKRYKTFSFILASSLAVSTLCGCSLVNSSQSASNETSLPTTSATTWPEISETTAVATTAETTEETTEAVVSEETYQTAVWNDDVDPEYVNSINGVTPEMMRADFWIGEDDNRILMDADEITEFNYNNRATNKTGDGVIMPKFDEFGEVMDGNILRAFLKENADSVPDEPSKYYLNGHQTTRGYWQNLVELSNMDAVEDEVKVRYGFTVKRMTVRLFPTEDKVYNGKSDRFFDYMLYSECMPFMPVVVLHESLDGEYLYVVFDSFSSWVRKDAIALCKDRDDWQARQFPENRLVVTAREIRLGDDPHLTSTEDLVLPMGTYISLVSADDAPSEINQRASFCDYVVKIPTRGSDGYIKDEYFLIPVSDDVHVGFLPLTPANIVRQAMKLLGDRYGWGGDLRANDCTGITREIYRCFGVLLPRVGQSNSKGIYKVDLSDMSDEEKLAEIEKLYPGSLISFTGHMMIYLGTVDGVPYVISAVGTLVEPGSSEILHPRSVVINSLYVKNSKMNTWLGISQTALMFIPER